MKRALIRFVPVIIAIVIVGAQFMSSEKFTNEAGRSARMGLTVPQEDELGLQAYREVLSKADTVSSGRDLEMVREVARRLGAAADESNGDQKKGRRFSWEVSLVKAKEINAFCLPGGKIVVYTGILPVAKTPAGLAAIMGHEMAHATARHGSERMFQQKATQTVMTGVQFSLGDMDYQQRQAIMGALGAGAQYGILMPFGRDHEVEADQIGLIYMARAGYNPEEAIQFWTRMGEASKGEQQPEFLSTHPAHGTRIERLKEIMPKALEIYRAKLGKQGDTADAFLLEKP